MALYRWSTKVSWIWQSFNPENTGTEWQVLTKTNSWYAYCDKFPSGWTECQVLTKTASWEAWCDSQWGWGSDLYNIKYLAVWGWGWWNGWKGSYGWGWWAVLYWKQWLNTDSINITIWCWWYACWCMWQFWWPTLLKNDEFIIVAKWWGWSAYWCNYCVLAQKYLSYSWNWFGNLCWNSCCATLWWWGAWWYANWCNWWAWLCWYGWGWASQSWTATDWWWVVVNFCWQNATKCWWWGWSWTGSPTHWWDWAPWIVKICYACDWSWWINTATWGNSCYVCDWYCVHEFTSDWTFCITG